MAPDFVGTIDMAKVPIEWNPDETLSGDAHRVQWALTTIAAAASAGGRWGVFS